LITGLTHRVDFQRGIEHITRYDVEKVDDSIEWPSITSIEEATAVTITFTDNAVTDVNKTAPGSYTFSGAAIGTASADRQVIVAVSLTNFPSAGTISGVTIGGVTAAFIARAEISTVLTEIWSAEVPTGATGDVVVSFATSNATQCGIGVWAMTGAATAADGSASDTDTGTDSGTGFTLSAAITVPANGAFVAYAADEAAIWDASYVWANATEAFNEAVEPNASHSGADGNTSATVEVTGTRGGGSDASRALVIAAWGPA